MGHSVYSHMFNFMSLPSFTDTNSLTVLLIIRFPVYRATFNFHCLIRHGLIDFVFHLRSSRHVPMYGLSTLCRLRWAEWFLFSYVDVSIWHLSFLEWCDGSSDRSFMGMDPLSYFSFQPVFHDWYNKGCGMCYPVCGMVHIKEPLLLIGKSSLCGGRFPFSLSEWSLTPYNRK